MAITPFKVTDFGTIRKPICDFLLVIIIIIIIITEIFRVA